MGLNEFEGPASEWLSDLMLRQRERDKLEWVRYIRWRAPVGQLVSER